MFHGRHYELKLLNTHHNSSTAELAVIYGRRRIGKSTMIKKFLQSKNSLYFEAIEGLSQKQQIDHFLTQLSDQMHIPKYDCRTWKDVCEALTPIFEIGDWVIAFDEFPWMASKRNHLISLFKFYWDQKWKNNPNLMMILCGSVANFMIDHVIHSRALHNRKTIEIKLSHLQLFDVQHFFNKRSYWDIAKIMMMVGGVPKYIEALNPKKSAMININNEFFSKDGFFVNEFDTLFKEQFRITKHYEMIVSLLAKKSMSLTDISKALPIESGGTLKTYLRNLENAGFIQEWQSLSFDQKKTKTRKYTLIDPFLRTHFKFIHPNKQKIMLNTHYNLADSIMKYADSFWGHAFDWLIMCNIDNVLRLLDLSLSDIVQYGPYFTQNSRKTGQPGVQIDLMILRNDHTVSIIENKFTHKPIGATILDEFQSKVDKLNIPTHITPEYVLISASGVTPAVKKSNYFHHIITLENLFSTP